MNQVPLQPEVSDISLKRNLGSLISPPPPPVSQQVISSGESHHELFFPGLLFGGL